MPKSRKLKGFKGAKLPTLKSVKVPKGGLLSPSLRKGKKIGK